MDACRLFLSNPQFVALEERLPSRKKVCGLDPTDYHSAND